MDQVLFLKSEWKFTEMATHSSTLAWKIPWTDKRGRLQSMGSQRVRHDWATSLSMTLLGSKITADGDCNHEIRRRLLLGRKAITNLDSVLKSRHITLPTKVHIVKAMVLVITYSCKSSTIKKVEPQRIDAFELCCWRRLLRVPWTARRSNQSILQEINPEHSLEGLMLKLKLQYSVIRCEQLTHWKSPWCWGQIEGRRKGTWGWEGWMASPMQSKLREMVRDRHDWPDAIHGVAKNETRLGNWTTTTMALLMLNLCWKYNPPKQNCSYGKMLPILGKEV